MATIDPVIVKIEADVSDLKAGLQRAEATLKSLDDNVKKADSAFAGMGTRLKQLGATIGVTFGASQLISFFKSSVAASQEAEAAQDRLRQLLINTNDATEEQISALSKQAEALEKIGVVSKDNITVTQSQLATFDLSAAAIAKLTPAVLDYVTAEKGAAASADEFKGMTNSLAQALQGNFASLTKVGFVLDDATKKQISSGTEAERTAALVKVLNSTYKDFNANLRDTSQGAMQVAINDFNNLKQEIGDGLQPVVDGFSRFLTKVLFPALRGLMKFLKDNKDEIKAFAITLGIGATAWGVYTIVMNRAKIAQAALNLVMKANPIAIVITGVALLVAGIVKLWNSSETFRKVVISVAKAALTAFASIIPIVARVYEAIAKIVTGPMRLFLGALSKLPGVGKYAKSGLDLINKGLDGISDLGDKAAKKANELSKRLDGLAKITKKTKDDMKDGGLDFGDYADGKLVSDKTKRQIESQQNKLKEYYKDIADIRRDAEEKIAEAQERYAEKISEAQERYAEAQAAANARWAKRDAEIRKENAKRIIEINKDFAKKELEIREQYNAKLEELQKDAETKRIELRKSAVEKEASLMQQSMDRLRSAFASALGFSIKDEYEKGGGVAGLIASIREKLTAAKDLQENAAALAAKGYTQTFIEQVVQAGPQIGNQLAKSLLDATPESTKEMQDLFGEIEKVSNSGLDELARTMNQGGNLATEELRKAYKQVAIDLQTSLNEVDVQLKANLAEAQKVFDAAVLENAKLRTEKLAEQAEAYSEALAENNADLNEALAEAQKDLQKALLEAQKDFNKAIDDINSAMQKKLDDLMAKILAIKQALATLGALTILGSTGSGGGSSGGGGGSSGTGNNNGYTQARTADRGGITVNQNITSTMADPHEIAKAALSAVRFGQTVTTSTPPTVRGIPVPKGLVSSKTSTVPRTVRGIPVK